jgi:hypothetical protein
VIIASHGHGVSSATRNSQCPQILGPAWVVLWSWDPVVLMVGGCCPTQSTLLECVGYTEAMRMEGEGPQ